MEARARCRRGRRRHQRLGAARQCPAGLVFLRHGAAGVGFLGGTGRHRAAGVSCRLAGPGTGVHGRRGSVAPRIPRSPTTMAHMVAGGRADAGHRWPHVGRLPVCSDRAGTDRGVLLRDQPLLGMVAAFGSAYRSQHPRQRAARARSDRHGIAGRIHGGMPFSRGAAVDRRPDRPPLRSSQAAYRADARVAGGHLRCRTRELSRLSGVLAAGRAGDSGIHLGPHFFALRFADDGDPARRFRPCSDVDTGFPGRRLRQWVQSGACSRCGNGASRHRRFLPSTRRKMAGAAGDISEPSVADRRCGCRGRSGTHPRRGRALDHSCTTRTASAWNCGIVGDSIWC